MRILIALLLLFRARSFAQDDAKPVPPVLISKVEPTYSAEARADHLSGSVLVSLTVGIDGVPTDIKVVKGLGEGLDEKAVEAVSQWRFQPGTKKGVAVAVQAQVSVNFKLLNDPQKAAASPASSDATAPSLISKVEPDYSKEAREKKLSGNVLLSLVVGADGVPRNIKVVSPLGLGLDEKAIEAVSKWRFRPGTKGGVPVPVQAQVEVSFKLCNPDCGSSPELAREERARSLVNTAVHQLRGDLDGKTDAKAAFQTMQKAADMDYGPAETRLGRFYLSGTGTPVDNKKAAELFDRAAFHGDAEGEYELGKLYNTGTGVERDQTMAVKLFIRAADKDLPEAEFALGVASEVGEGAPQDLPQAVKWYRKSAEQGFSVAQLRLARMLWTGAAGKQDQVAALEWALLAERSDLKEASADVQQFRTAMPADRIAEAEKHALHFKPRAPKPKHSQETARAH
jgi:TonB family protein